MKPWIIRAVLLVIWVLSLTILAAPLAAQDDAAAAETTAQPADDSCTGTRYLMERGLTPYQMTGEGGVLRQAEHQTIPFDAGIYSQFYHFNIIRPSNASGDRINAALLVTFSDLTPGLSLEYALYYGMDPVQPPAPLQDGPFTITLARDGVYTLMIRRTHVQDSDTPGRLSLIASYPGNTDVTEDNLPDSSTRLLLAEPPVAANGVTTITVPSTRLRLNSDSAISAGSQNGRGVQVRYDGGAILIGGWAQNVDLLGGDLAAYGETQTDNIPRIFYLQDWGHRREYTSDTLNIEDPNGNRITTDWQIVRGIWLLRTCIGISLLDGRTFVAPTQPQGRQVTFTGSVENFSIRLNSISPLGNLLPYVLNIDWSGIRAGSEVTLNNGVLITELDGDRLLSLESTQITLDRVEPPPDSASDLQQVITLADRGASVTLDWQGIRQFRLAANEFSLDFTDARAALVQSVTRSALSLQELRALNDVIQIRYKDLADGNPGEHRMLLSEAESYLEIITPAGFPSFNSLAQPGEVGYSPRALNNLGGECYPVNTALAEANCPPNGEPNPANNNIWYGVTDLMAEGGYGLHLALTRSYNSRANMVDSPFGFGWTTDYLVDYNVPFDPAIGTRPVTPEVIQGYRIGLDLTYAPRGLVVFTTPTGSRHVFTSEPTPNFGGGTMTSLTMPGWTLTRTSVFTSWTLRQTDGLTYEFDRGGRVVRYGYPQFGRTISVEYPGVSLTPTSQIQFPDVAISDDFSLRQIELYYEGDHIARSVMRDMTQSDAFGPCEASTGCYENIYRYSNGDLVEVVYSDGSTATYTYDDQHRMIAHNDPRAPITPEMTYTYTENNLTEIATVIDGQPIPWKIISAPQQGNEQRVITITNEFGRRRTYTYSLDGTRDLRERSNAYTLTTVTSPLPNAPGNDGLTQTFVWQDGLLTRINPRVSGNNIGRNSISFEYDPAGELNRVTGGFLEFSLNDQPGGLGSVAQFADGTAQSYTYDERGRPVSVTDRQGNTFQIVWDASGQMQQFTRISDGYTTTYTHNSLGLITSVAVGGHVTRYDYDALGRLIRIEDAQLGVYTIRYLRGEGSTEMIITNPLGVISTSRFDGQGRRVESILAAAEGASGDVVRRTRYEYNAFDQLTAEIEDLGPDASGQPQALTTQYIYMPVPELQNPDGSTTVINGYSITRQDPLGRREIYTYDAFNRIRQVEDILQQVTQYEYAPVQAPNYPNGFLITSRRYRAAVLNATTSYIFDLRGQLREVERETGNNVQQWVFNTEGDAVRPRFLISQSSDVRSLTWGGYRGIQPSSIELNPVLLELPSEFEQPTARLNITFDTRGRPVQITDGSGRIIRRAYCMLENGGYEIRSSQPSQVEEFGCGSEVFGERAVFDIHDRLLAATDIYGTRTFSYQQDAETQEWVVTVDFDGGDQAGSQNGNQWELRYNAAGDLTLWRDTYGVEHIYRYDLAGRLIRVEIEGMPEGSFTFEYNAIDQLTRQVDDLGRGFVYQYDSRGLLLVRQDVLTGDTSIYSYFEFGQIRSVVLPQGNTIFFRYEDPNDPTRLTSIVDPTNVNQRFTWDDRANTLTYTDVRGNATTYTFDAFGALWLISDSAGRFHEFHYDGSGNLTEALTTVTASGAVRNFTLARPDANSLIVREADQPNWAWSFDFNGAILPALTGVTDPNSNTIQFDYDALRRLESMIIGAHTVTLERPPGEMRLEVNGAPYQFDELNRLTQVGEGENAVTYAYGVDTRGGTSVTLTAGDVTRTYTFSPGNDSTRPRTVTVTAPGETLTYSYNADNLITEFRSDACIAPEVTSCVPGEGTIWTRTVRFNYDGQGRPVRIIDEEQNVETFSYDDAGNLIAYQSAGGRTFNYTYDVLNRLASVTSPTGVRVLLNYDALDNVTGICRTRAETASTFTACVDANGEQDTFSYDSLGRLVEQTFPNLGSPSGSATIQQRYAGNRLESWGIRNQPDYIVTRGYTADIFSLLTSVATNTGAIDFSYDDSLRLQSAGGEQYAYDLFGRLSSLTTSLTNGQSNPYTIDYLDGNRGYSILNDASGEFVQYMLDDRGFLAALDYGLLSQGENPASTIPLTGIVYRLNPNQPDTLGVVVSTQASDDTQDILDLQLNRRRETLFLAAQYADASGGTSQLLVDYLTNPGGQAVRQRISGGPATQFVEEANGYIITTGYNDDNQPTSVTVSGENSGLLYQLIFTYNDAGQRLTESRSYSDNTQVSISYEYGTPNQLLRRVIQIIPPSIVTSGGLIPTAAATIGLPFMLAWRRSRKLKRWTRRLLHIARSRTVIIGAGIFAGLMLFSVVEAQQSTQTFIFEYDYDVAGNVAGIEFTPSRGSAERIVCRTYRYDTANRLIGVTYPTQEVERAYYYDAFNRLVGSDDTQLVYAGEQPFMAVSGETRAYFGRIDDRAPLWVAFGPDDIRWQILDGRDDLLSTEVLSETGELRLPVSLHDPLSRSIPLRFDVDVTAEGFDPCLLNNESDDIRSLINPYGWRGTLSDVNLYFTMDGRAYDPVIGRYLQRSPYGPSLFGNVYELKQEQSAPALHDGAAAGGRGSGSAANIGLDTYLEALDTIRSADALTAEQIAHSYYPQIRMTSDWTTALAGPSAATQTLAELLALPTYLQQGYNLTGVRIDHTSGAVTLDTQSTPGQNGGPFHVPDLGGMGVDLWSPTPVDMPQTIVQRLDAARLIPFMPLTSYRSRAWLPDSQVMLSSLWKDRAPQLSTDNTPDAVLRWLPGPLKKPEASFRVLEFLDQLAELPFLEGSDWYERLLDEALPDRIPLPPHSMEEYRKRWFTNDTFGLEATLTERIEVPSPPYVPVYGLGYNGDWMFPHALR